MPATLLLLTLALAGAQELGLCRWEGGRQAEPRDREAHFTYGGHKYTYSGRSKYLDRSQVR